MADVAAPLGAVFCLLLQAGEYGTEYWSFG